MTAYSTYDRSPRQFGDYNYVYFFMMLFITVFIVCDTTAFRMTYFFGSVVPASGLIIPVLFALGDIIAEVYGYHISRKLIWNAQFCQVIYGFIVTAAVHLPSPEGMAINEHYRQTFQHIIRTDFTSCFSVTAGMFTNAFLMSRFKVHMNGRGFWIRTILSSSISEFALCFVAYVGLYFGLKSVKDIWHIIVTVWYYKVVFALIAAPIVSWLSKHIKRLEHSDVFDYDIDYNPFFYNVSASENEAEKILKEEGR